VFRRNAKYYDANSNPGESWVTVHADDRCYAPLDLENTGIQPRICRDIFRTNVGNEELGGVLATGALTQPMWYSNN